MTTHARTLHRFTPALHLLMAAAAIAMVGCATNRVSPAPPESVEIRFVPKPTGDGNGACWSALAPFIDGDIVATAHLGMGDWFPVAEPESPELFQVHLVAGDDAEVTVEARAGSVARRMAIQKDGNAKCEIAGDRYEFAYPRQYVAKSSLPATGTTGFSKLTPEGTASKIMLMVKRQPDSEE